MFWEDGQQHCRKGCVNVSAASSMPTDRRQRTTDHDMWPVDVAELSVGYWTELLSWCRVKGKGSSYSITEHRVPELIPVLGSQPAGDLSHKPGGRLPSLSARPAVTLATLERAATSFAAWWTEARWLWTVCLRLLPDSVAAAIWT